MTEEAIKTDNVYIDEKSADGGHATFTLKHTNVSMANAIRRTILMDVPALGFKTFPHNENQAIIHKNTSRLNNEMLKQRLSCIPIHISNHTLPIGELEVEINVKNDTNTTIYVTTANFKIKNTTSGKYLEEGTRGKIFPPDPVTGGYIIFARLRPKISNEVPGEELSITAKMSIHTAKEDGVYNTVSACAYSFTDDKMMQDEEWRKYLSNIPEEEKSSETTVMLQKNWYSHDAKRFYKKDSFDFILESIGVFSCYEIVHMALEILVKKLSVIELDASKKTLTIEKSASTMPNSFDITLVNENYTIGKVLEYMLHKNFFEKSNILKYVGFRQDHPHDEDSRIRMAVKGPEPSKGKAKDNLPVDDEILKATVSVLIQKACEEAKVVFQTLMEEFSK